MQNHDDWKLMQSVARGEQKAFRAIYEAHRKKVWGVCVRMLGATPRAEDMAQEAWLKIVANANQYRSIGKLSAWICQVTRNICLNEIRGTKWNENLELEIVEEKLADEVTPENIMLNVSDKINFEKAFSSLVPQQRAVLMMFVHEELSHSEIAQELNISVGAVKQLVFRAKESLRRTLKDVL